MTGNSPEADNYTATHWHAAQVCKRVSRVYAVLKLQVELGSRVGGTYVEQGASRVYKPILQFFFIP